MKKSDIMTSVLILVVIMIIILPIDPWLLDALLIMNIMISLFIMLTTLFIKDALEFSVLPTLLLITTLFRLSLNLASTKLILGNAGDAGEEAVGFAEARRRLERELVLEPNFPPQIDVWPGIFGRMPALPMRIRVEIAQP